jgi:hypothetical protein
MYIEYVIEVRRRFFHAQVVRASIRSLQTVHAATADRRRRRDRLQRLNVGVRWRPTVITCAAMRIAESHFPPCTAHAQSMIRVGSYTGRKHLAVRNAEAACPGSVKRRESYGKLSYKRFYENSTDQRNCNGQLDGLSTSFEQVISARADARSAAMTVAR